MVQELGISLSLGLFEFWYLALPRNSGRTLLMPDITGWGGGGGDGYKQPSSSPGLVDHGVFGLLCASQSVDDVPGLPETEQAAEVKGMSWGT